MVLPGGLNFVIRRADDTFVDLILGQIENFNLLVVV